MSSWFNVDSFKDLTEKVQQALPAIDPETIQKLTLTTPELTAERQRIDMEERRKEEIKESLSGLLPWETRDAERDILVEECKEAILQLSSNKSTFFGPYKMPGQKVNLKRDKEDTEKSEEAEDDDDDDGNSEDEEATPSDSLQKLAKLEPLPVLLRDFDLNAHVGLINRLLKEDPKLVTMQSHLSGGGERELIFWKNYFFHCAYTRYEAGLSIDEIWSDQPPEQTIPTEATGDEQEETITFDAEKETPQKAFVNDPISDASNREGNESVAPSAAASEGASEYDMVNDAEDSQLVDDSPDVDDLADYELDELEAEIARELED